MLGSTPTTSDADTAESAADPDERLTEHVPSGRLVAQRGLFRGPDPVCPDDLYARVVRGGAVRDRQRLVVHPGSEVTMDTYFGRFPASYWQRWTVVDQVDVEVTASGTGQVALIASDIDGELRTIAVHDLSGQGDQVTLTAALDKFVDGGFLWVRFTTDDAELTVERLRWTVAPPKRLRPTAVVICTFNRADDCTKTLQSLAADQEALEVLDAVYVTDQGSDTVESRPAFPEIQQGLGGRLRYLRQPNLGGAGGFGRGMYEVTRPGQAEHANLLFMDDDVLCEPEIAVRLTAFANRTPSPTIVGGQMLRLLHPTRLLAGAEYADFAQLVPGKVVRNALDDVDLTVEEVDATGTPTGHVNRGDKRVDADYNAWWSCLIPAEVVAAIGLPMPLFFQWDDVEYGYRARAKGFPTVTLPGAGLWHADFDWKDLDKWNEYFAVRNGMIVSALHAEIDPKQIARVLTSRISRYLLSMQYGLAATLIKAAEDFLAGPEFLADGGASAAKEVFALRADYPDTIMHKASDVPGIRTGTIKQVQAGPKPSNNRLTLLKRLAYLAMDRSVHPIGAVSKKDATWWHVSQFDTAVVTDGSQEGVRVRRRDRELTIRLAKQAAKAVRRVIAEMPRLREEYRAAVPQLTSRENWRRLYDID
ncbi:glycosyltransferase [Actinophytocola gossypii]|uniref:Glycosyltransferase n=1 Tax=Actinophytocola gossypii TaxID=2812003 RepID=A0ABT2JG22_9PSEU|nr:glycosyltransferase [Actinophytocola gossypii]MCT2586691.1 glycosyltransferase [Actinophytocola gossypii]